MSAVLDLGTLLVRITADATMLDRVVGRSLRTFDDAANKMGRIGTRMSLAVTAPLALVGTKVARTILDFDQGMTRALSIVEDASPAISKQMEDVARSISRETIHRPQELANAYFHLAQAGYTAQQSMASLRPIANFATAAQLELEKATSLLSQSQSALGLNSNVPLEQLKNLERVTNVLTKASNLTTASQTGLATALTNKAAAAARILNKDVEETVAVLSVFAKVGVQGELAGERLDIVWRDLGKAATQHQDEWRKLGLSVFDANGTMRNTADIVGDLDRALKPLNDQQKMLTLSTLGFQYRSVSAIKQLLGLQDLMRGYERQLRTVGDETNNLAEKQMKSLTNRLEKLRSRFADASLQLQDDFIPVFDRVERTLNGLLEWWNKLDPAQRRQIASLAMIAAAAGPVLLVTSAMMKSVAMLTRVVGVGVTVFGSMKTIVGALRLGFIGLATYGITAVARKLYDVISGTANFNAQMERSLALTSKLNEGQNRQQSRTMVRLTAIDDPRARKRAIESEIARATKEVSGYKAMIAGAERQLNSFGIVSRTIDPWIPSTIEADIATYNKSLSTAERFIDDLKDSLNQTDIEAKRLTLDLKNVGGPDVQNQWDGLIEGAEKAGEAIQDLLDDVQRLEMQAVGVPEELAKGLQQFEKLGVAGAPEEMLNRFTELFDKCQQLQDQLDLDKSLREDADRLISDLATPLEQFQQQIDRIAKLKDAGLIDDEFATRGVMQAVESANGPEQEDRKTAAAPKTPELHSGFLDETQKRFAMLQSGSMFTKTTEDAVKETATLLRDIKVSSGDTARALERLKIPAPPKRRKL